MSITNAYTDVEPSSAPEPSSVPEPTEPSSAQGLFIRAQLLFLIVFFPVFFLSQ